MTSWKMNADDVKLSKQLSWLLRHGAEQEGIEMRADGFVSVASILQHPRYSPHFTQAVLERLVSNDKKQRYMLRRNPNTNTYEIRANQGHSMKSVESAHCLEEIKRADSIPLAVHGTYMHSWKLIKEQGLRRMKRNHIHFATFDKSVLNASTKDAISGFRNDCQVLIYLDVEKVLNEGLMKLYRSANGVVLCAGLGESGIIPTAYFKKVVNRRTGELLSF